jgi:hypothetical protein
LFSEANSIYKNKHNNSTAILELILLCILHLNANNHVTP